jgi:DNA-binding GntR family transcriptional regulator
LNASRTPVRDAVSRLEQEHLVSIRPKKGIKVNRVSMNSIRELFEVRRMLEPEVVLRYGNRIPDEVYARYILQFERTDLAMKEENDLDHEFHQIFITASNNRYYKSVYEMIADQVYRYRVLTSEEARLGDTQQEHYEIAANCIRGEWDLASAAMLRHIENSKLSIVDYVMKTNRNARNVFEEDEDD